MSSLLCSHGEHYKITHTQYTPPFPPRSSTPPCFALRFSSELALPWLHFHLPHLQAEIRGLGLSSDLFVHQKTGLSNPSHWQRIKSSENCPLSHSSHWLLGPCYMRKEGHPAVLGTNSGVPEHMCLFASVISVAEILLNWIIPRIHHWLVEISPGKGLACQSLKTETGCSKVCLGNHHHHHLR